jgi:spore coat protein U-like protein
MPTLTRILILFVAVVISLVSTSRSADAVNCRNFNATPIDFGIYNPNRVAPTLSQGTVRVRCTGLGQIKGKSVLITLESGISGNCSDRHMVSGQSVLRYGLFRDAAHTQPVGRASHGCVFLFGPAQPPRGVLDLSLTIYGLIPPQQSIASGTYVDTIHVVVEFFD